MTTNEILGELERRGINVEMAGDRLRFRPREAITPALLETLRAHKAALLRALSERNVPARVRGQDAESGQPEVCWHCHGEKLCSCALCAIRGRQPLTWESGSCGACFGTGCLTWPEQVQ